MTKKVIVLFSMGVLGVVICLVMTLYTGVHEYQKKNISLPRSIPLPATRH